MKNIKTEDLSVIFGVNHGQYVLTNKEHLYDIISKPAYKDMTPRNLKGIGKCDKNKKKSVFNWLADEFLNFFNADAKKEDEFDKWHKCVCSELCKKIQGLCDVEVHYGKAQKLVNMSFKHFYLFSDAEEKKEYFTYCHMPLDSYTLKWFSRDVSNNPKVSCAWSNLEYEEYFDIQKKIRNYFKSGDNKDYIDELNKPLIPLTAEFYIWLEEQYNENPDKFLIQPCNDFLKSIENIKTLTTFVKIDNDNMMQKFKDIQDEIKQLLMF